MSILFGYEHLFIAFQITLNNMNKANLLHDIIMTLLQDIKISAIKEKDKQIINVDTITIYVHRNSG